MNMDRVGNFRGDILGMAVTAAKESKSKFINIKCSVHDHWNGTEWEDWRGYEMVAFGSLCIIKKDGVINTVQAEPLMQHSGWDGDFTKLESGEFNPIRFSTKERTYDKDGQSVTVYEIEWINAYDSTPGGGLKSNVDEGDLKSLNTQFGAQLRALRGNGQRNAAKPTGKPSSPPPAAQPAQAASGDIPF